MDQQEHADEQIRLLEEIVEQEAQQTRLLKNISAVATFFAILIVIAIIVLVLLQTGG